MVLSYYCLMNVVRYFKSRPPYSIMVPEIVMPGSGGSILFAVPFLSLIACSGKCLELKIVRT